MEAAESHQQTEQNEDNLCQSIKQNKLGRGDLMACEQPTIEEDDRQEQRRGASYMDKVVGSRNNDLMEKAYSSKDEDYQMTTYQMKRS